VVGGGAPSGWEGRAQPHHTTTFLSLYADLPPARAQSELCACVTGPKRFSKIWQQR